MINFQTKYLQLQANVYRREPRLGVGVENSKKLLCQFSVNLIGTSWHIVTQQLPVHLSHAMNNVILRGILVVIIATSGFLMVTTDSPYPLATLGIAIICFAIIPKRP